MPKNISYPTEKAGAKPGEGASSRGNAADIRRAKAPKGSYAEHVENSMKAGESSLPTVAPNSIVKHTTKPMSPSANQQSRNRSTYKRFFDEVQGNK